MHILYIRVCCAKIVCNYQNRSRECTPCTFLLFLPLYWHCYVLNECHFRPVALFMTCPYTAQFGAWLFNFRITIRKLSWFVKSLYMYVCMCMSFHTVVDSCIDGFGWHLAQSKMMIPSCAQGEDFPVRWFWKVMALDSWFFLQLVSTNTAYMFKTTHISR
jgi:hypothetical protein